MEDKGNKGDKGLKGLKGDNKGEKGDKGNPGDVTAKGAKGDAGTPGIPTKGQKGQQGEQGTPTKGQKGQQGEQGIPGTPTKGQKGDSVKGSKGAAGDSVKGSKGAAGDSVKGEPGVAGLDATGPIGQIVVWSGSIGANYSNIPDGYLLCNGTQIPNGTSNNVQGKSGDFSALYSIVGAYIPDLENTFIMGAAETGVGDKGGSANAVLISHTHTQEGGGTDDDGGPRVPGGYSTGTMTNISNTGIDNTGTVKTDGSVSGTNANLPPYYKLAYIIKFSDSGEAQKGQKGQAGSTSGITINTPGNERIVTSTGASDSLDCEEYLKWDTSLEKLTVTAASGNGYVHIHPGDGCIEIYRKEGLTNASGPFIDFKDAPGNDYDVRLYNHEDYDMLVVAPKAAHNASTFHVDGNFSVNGSITKNSGSFKISHPLVGLSSTKDLVHSFLEGPQCDNIYRGKIDLVDGVATINIDNKVGMTEGTFVALNRDVQCFTTNETGWTAVKGSVSGNILTITAQPGITTTGITTNTCTDTISWMVIGERQDPSIKESNLTDADGNLILEPDHIPSPSLPS